MLDILSSPLRGYLAQTLQYYLSKYLKDIHLEGLGFFGNDLILNDLEIKRHVLQTALDIPSSFDFSRGFIRVHGDSSCVRDLTREPDDLEAELLKDIEATSGSSSKAPTGSVAAQNPAEATDADDRQSDDVEGNSFVSSLHAVTIRVSIQHTSLTLRCHAPNDSSSDPSAFSFSSSSTTPIDQVEFVPVANMGLVQVASFSPAHTKTKISKAAEPVAIINLTGTLVSWAIDDSLVKELVVEVENVVGQHIVAPRADPALTTLASTTTTPVHEEFLRMGTFHSTGQRSSVHPNVDQSLFALELHNDATWNPLLQHVRHLLWDPETQTHVYEYSALPSTPLSTKIAAPGGANVALASPFGVPQVAWPPPMCTCTSRHKIESIEAFWSDAMALLRQNVLSSGNATNQRATLIDDISQLMLKQYAPSSATTLQRLVEDLVNTFQQAVTVSNGLNMSTALRASNYSPLHPVAPSTSLFIDSQFLLHDLSILEDRTLRRRVSPLFHDLPSSSLFGILLCLDPVDVHTFATAAGIDHLPPDMATMEQDALLRWQYTTHLARQCIAATTPRPRCRVKLPLMCTARSFTPTLSYEESVFLSLFMRNYGGSGIAASTATSPATMYLTGHMESVDVVVTAHSLRSIVDLVDTIDRTKSSCASNSSVVRPTAPPSTGHDNTTASLPCIAFQTDAIRLILPMETMVCVDNLHVESFPGHDHLSMEGLSSPPFTPLQKKPRHLTPMYRPRLSPTSELPIQSLQTRLQNVYVANVTWKPATQMVEPVSGSPFEVSLARVTRRHPPLALANVTYIMPPIQVSVDVDMVKSPRLAEPACLELSLHVTKVIVDLPRSCQVRSLVNVTQRYVQAIEPSKNRSPHNARRHRRHANASSATPRTMTLGCRFVVDGIELHVGTSPRQVESQATPTRFDPIVHVRVGSMSAAHSACTGQGSASVKIVVVAFQHCEHEETLVLAPFADPSEWQVAVEKYPETSLSATWTMAAVSNVWELSALVELQGQQCHLSSSFIEATRHLFSTTLSRGQRRFADRTTQANQMAGVRTAVPIAGVPVQLGKVKLLWSPSAATYSSNESKSASASAVMTFGPVFASLHVGYNATEMHQVQRDRPRSVLHQYMPLTVVEGMGTVQGIRLAVATFLQAPTSATAPSTLSMSSQSSWTTFESRVTLPDPSSVLLQDFQVRGAATVHHVVALESSGKRLCSGNDFVIDVQVESTPIDGAICFESWTLLDGVVADLGRVLAPTENPISIHEADANATCGPSTREATPTTDDDVDLDAPPSSSPPTLNDFVELDLCSDSSRVHPVPGELLHITSPTLVAGSSHPFQVAATMRLTAATLQDDIDRLVHHVNDPWLSRTDDVEEEGGATTIGRLRWAYHLPRRVCRLVASPLPLSDVVVHEQWPRLQLSDRVTRLCDVWCDLRCWSTADSTFVSVGSSYSDPEDLTGYSVSCAIPHVQLMLRRGQGELHDVARLKCTDLAVGLHSALSSFRVTGAVTGELQNMVTLSSIPVLPPVHVAIGGWSAMDSHHGAENACDPSDQRMTVLRMTKPIKVSRIRMSASPVRLQLTPYAVKCLMEWPTLVSETPHDLTDMRILVTNGTSEVVRYRQVSTRELRALAPHAAVVYSWQSIHAPLQLQFAVSGNHWCSGCDLSQPGVMHRECPVHGSFWVEVSVDGIQIQVTLRGSVMLHNFTAQTLLCKLTIPNKHNDVVARAAPCGATASIRQDCSCTVVPFMARSQARLCLGLDPSKDGTEDVAWSVSLDLVPAVNRLESAPTTSAPTTRATLVSVSHPASPRSFHAWVVVTRAVSPVVDVVDKSARTVLAPSRHWALTEYNPRQQHTLVFASPSASGVDTGSKKCPLLHFDIPRFVSVEDATDMPSYPSAAIQVDIPNHGFVTVTRHAPGIPMRCIALCPRFRVRNDLPIPMVLRFAGSDDDASSPHVHIPAGSDHDTGWPSFFVGVEPYDTLVWSTTTVTMHVLDAPTAMVWSFKAAHDQPYVVRGVVIKYATASACETVRITIAPVA
ncbi:hypothetical protein DYB32_007856, partial [Aphanomyces invadans]